MITDLDEAIVELYARKINSGHQTLSDGGIIVCLGDELNGRKAETTLPPESFGSAGTWLLAAARRVFPDEFPDRPSYQNENLSEFPISAEPKKFNDVERRSSLATGGVPPRT